MAAAGYYVRFLASLRSPIYVRQLGPSKMPRSELAARAIPPKLVPGYVGLVTAVELALVPA